MEKGLTGSKSRKKETGQKTSALVWGPCHWLEWRLPCAPPGGESQGVNLGNGRKLSKMIATQGTSTLSLAEKGRRSMGGQTTPAKKCQEGRCKEQWRGI